MAHTGTLPVSAAEPKRSVKIGVNLTPQQAARLRAFARKQRWTDSTAAAVLIEQALDTCSE